MSYAIIGETEAFSTWGKCRGVLYKTTTGLGGGNTHSLVATSDSWKTIDGTFFRMAEWPKIVPIYPDVTAITGPYAFASGAPGTGFGSWSLAGYNFVDPSMGYAPHNLDDKEIQATWVGRTVTLNSGNLAMAYSALNGTTGAGQSAPDTSSYVVSFDL